MKPWPESYIPPIPFVFPPLKLKATWGSSVERDIFNIYVCGITPYDATHLGHALTYLNFDLINRYKKLNDKRLNFIENVTDIDDPLFERARRDGIDWKNLSDSQTKLFIDDMTSLRVIPPSHFSSVSETIDLVIDGIRKLKDKKMIYQLGRETYFMIKDFLNELPIAEKEAIAIFRERGGDPDREGKSHPLDPILWRGSEKDEPSWSSPFGEGRPGWHIECAVIAVDGSGRGGIDNPPTLDMQGGGRDLIFPHHFMTKVISECISGIEFAAEYVHTGLLGYQGEKMSKSKGNLVFVHKLLEEKIDPMVLRYALLKPHYSKDWIWTEEVLSQANEDVVKIRSALSKSEVAETAGRIKAMVMALADDLNTQSALNELIQWSEETLNGAVGGNVGAMSRFIDSALGLAL